MGHESVGKKILVFSAWIVLFAGARVWGVVRPSADGDETAKKDKTSGLAFLPVIFYTPETKWAFGGGGLYYFRLTKDRRLAPNLSFIAIYTQRNRRTSS
jgi:hypothetical protein